MPDFEIPVAPPKDWFVPPESIPTDKRITIEPDGRVYGYIALWGTCHVGHPNCVKPPKGSPSDYEYAHQGETMTAEGDLIKTAVIAGGQGHAPVDMKSANVPAYYENTGMQLMRVRYGEDDNGLWFAGALWPDVQELQIAQIRASSISGDWRWHAAWRKSTGGYDFAGSCLVNIPGYPMPAAGDLNERSGVPFALAAAFMPLQENDECIFLNGDTLTAGGSDVDCECNGDKTKCTCEDVETEDSAEDILAAVYQLMNKKLKKKPRTIKADAEVEDPVETKESSDLEKLTEALAEIRTAVDWLVADKLANDITKEND